MPTTGSRGLLDNAERDEDAARLIEPEVQQGAKAGRLRLSECFDPRSVFSGMVADEARKAEVGARALGVRTLLHLPRVATASGRMTSTQVARELQHSARWLRDDVRATADLVPVKEFALQELRFEPVAASQAETIVASLHYLRSARPGALNFALLDPADRLPVSLCSVSPLEWRRVEDQIQAQFGVARGRTWDVSRVYSCDVAPPNAISFLLARVRSWLRRSDYNVDLLTTAVDPNLGFTGSSYRAANWQQWLTVQPRPYLYQDRRYVSPRQLRQRFGTSSIAELQASHPGRRFEQSRARLLDSLIFGCRLNGETEPVPPESLRRLRR